MEDKRDELKKKTEELSGKIKETKEELKQLRKNCKHSEYTIKDTNFDDSRLELRKVCNFCGDTLGFPTKDDLKDNGYE